VPGAFGIAQNPVGESRVVIGALADAGQVVAEERVLVEAVRNVRTGGRAGRGLASWLTGSTWRPSAVIASTKTFILRRVGASGANMVQASKSWR
jgi:hypothetical protein